MKLIAVVLALAGGVASLRTQESHALREESQAH